ncbi:endonuclease VII domain-containing protein [Nonomuraea roseoviolacea subsp. roseoviolacea]|uniref:endonuclease VII domain-containing protein n=1 Tax=Nonomuraea roseoviolacea TaxID=103837 RepID=UPI00336D02E6
MGRHAYKISEEQSREIARKYAEGATQSALSREYSCTTHTIKHHVLKHGGTIRTGVGRPSGVCTLCHERPATASGKCEECRPRSLRNYHLKRRYGITVEDYDRILAEQGGGCAICGTTNPGGDGSKSFHVDHCHETNRVRGLLCYQCNYGLGYFGDSVEGIERVLRYLKRH